ncbi:MAG: hypothetical protein CL944_02725 [Candidatus Diapherotrites archaeon]|uniref:Alpha-galactosidase NEW3 domain-containing protein n=1 Tax=Candidatus Iainarchaeum sp. TaxID=3101447 RepID=A0A2D6LQB4_9ARCH|nr:hypothetical protein [Candidatus Diapherotrites archaeon]|tara:strand:+ start:1436 stop:2212 length:777 start_codon:yes stop_codon:yes gene_type:complete
MFLLLVSLAFAEVNVLYPVEATLQSGNTIQAGSVSPNQVFELIFSDNSGYGFEWDAITINEASLPSGWKIVSQNITDTSLIINISVPKNAQPNFYVLEFSLANSNNPIVKDSISVSVVVKQNLLDVSFARPPIEDVSVVGESVFYKGIVSNSSIAYQKIVFSSDVPSNWFERVVFEAEPNSLREVELELNPKSYGKHSFSFQVLDEEGTIIKSYSSELNVRPTLKGKFSSALSGFPFFTFSLVPFQLLDSFVSLILPN